MKIYNLSIATKIRINLGVEEYKNVKNLIITRILFNTMFKYTNKNY